MDVCDGERERVGDSDQYSIREKVRETVNSAIVTQREECYTPHGQGCGKERSRARVKPWGEGDCAERHWVDGVGATVSKGREFKSIVLNSARWQSVVWECPS